MQKALCNATAEQACEKHGSMHICSFDHGHKGKMHLCSCGVMFLRVKPSDLPESGAELKKKVQ